ncbi:MAG: family 20 glycosylhydrolase [Dysgonomonas sp.]
MGKNGIEPGYFENTFYFVNQGQTALENDWVIYFCQMPSPVKQQPELPVAIEQICATYFKMYPTSNYKPIAVGDTLKVTFRTRGATIKESRSPEGAYIVRVDKEGKESAPQDVPVKVVPFTHDYQWSRPGTAELPYPYGNVVYDQNKLFSEKVELTEPVVFPTPKQMIVDGGEVFFPDKVVINADLGFEEEALLLAEGLGMKRCIVTDSADVSINIRLAGVNTTYNSDEAYELNISFPEISIFTATRKGAFNAIQSLLMIFDGKQPYDKVPTLRIVDYPDFSYRGLMLDVARNFSKRDDVLKLIDLMAMYKMNVLHLHLSDDEGWRLAIPGLEELTQVGARRGHTHDERECLYPAYGGSWNPADPDLSGNGFYSRMDFITILEYAKRKHIKIIPEFDFPGHSRAAIKAMEARYHKYIKTDKEKAEEYLLTEFADTSRYVSVQAFTDNVINVAMPSTYRFVDKIIYELVSMYRAAGCELDMVHLGGDEVPKGAWTGSPLCKKLMAEKGMTETRELKDYFLEQVLSICKERNITLGGWQEIVTLPDGTVNTKFNGNDIVSYCWNTMPEWRDEQAPYKLASEGHPVILSNSSNLYLDQSYNRHQSEPGHYWAGFVNEFNSFDLLPFDIYKSVRTDMGGKPYDLNTISDGKQPLARENRKYIYGIQGQLWAETIRNFDMVEYYLFPKMFGLIERAWNAEPEWAKTPVGKPYEDAVKLYNAKISQSELPRLSRMDVNFRVAQPGAKVINGKLYMNSRIPDAELRYTTDGSEPTTASKLWTAPVACNAKQVKAKAFYLGKESVTTLLNVGK